MAEKPTGASLATPSVPRKSRSPSAVTSPERRVTPIDVATAFSVTPAQATSASSSMSPEQSSAPRSSGRRMQPRDGERPSGLDLAGDGGGIERAFCPERHHSRLRVGTVAVLERRLDCPDFVSVHCRASPSRLFTETNRTAGAPRETRSGRDDLRPRPSGARPRRRLSPSIVTRSASSPASSVATALGNLTTPFRSERSTSSLWLQCLQSCCTYLAALAVGTLALAVGMLENLSVFTESGLAGRRFGSGGLPPAARWGADRWAI